MTQGEGEALNSQDEWEQVDQLIKEKGKRGNMFCEVKGINTRLGKVRQ